MALKEIPHHTEKGDTSIISTLYINAILGFTFLCLFIWLHGKNRTLFQFRTVSESVTLRPPTLPRTGWSRIWAWAYTTLMMTDHELLLSCGMDMLVLSRLPIIGLQLMIPVAFFSLFILLPVHWNFRPPDFINNVTNPVNGTSVIQITDFYSSKIMYLTMAYIPQDDRILWLHFTLLYIYVLYGLAVMYWNYVQYAHLRKRYLELGDDVGWCSDRAGGTGEVDAEAHSQMQLMIAKVKKQNKDLEKLEAAALVKTQDGEKLGPTTSVESAFNHAASTNILEVSKHEGSASLPPCRRKLIIAGPMQLIKAAAARMSRTPKQKADGTNEADDGAQGESQGMPPTDPAALQGPPQDISVVVSGPSGAGAPPAPASDGGTGSSTGKALEPSADATSQARTSSKNASQPKPGEPWKLTAAGMHAPEAANPMFNMARRGQDEPNELQPQPVESAEEAARLKKAAKGIPVMFLRRPSLRHFRTLWVEQPVDAEGRALLEKEQALETLRARNELRAQSDLRFRGRSLADRPLLASQGSMAQRNMYKDSAAPGRKKLIPVQAKYYAVLVTDVKQHPYEGSYNMGEARFDRVLGHAVKGAPERCAEALLPMQLMRKCFRSFGSPEKQESTGRFLLAAGKAKSFATDEALDQACTAAAAAAPESSDGSEAPVPNLTPSALGPASLQAIEEDVVVPGTPHKAGMAGKTGSTVMLLHPDAITIGFDDGRKKRTAAELWAVARSAVWSGEVRLLPAKPEFDAVSAIFQSMFPLDFDRALPVFNCGIVEALLQRWNKTMDKLDLALASWEDNGVRPLMKLSRCGDKVDAIEHLSTLMVDLQIQIVQERERALSGKDGAFTGAYIVLFKTQVAATLAAGHKTLHCENMVQFRMYPAPSPEEVNWPVISTPSSVRARRKWTFLIPRIIVILLPVSGLAAAFTQIETVLCPKADANGEVVGSAAYVSQTFCSKNIGMEIARSLVFGWFPSFMDTLYAGYVLPKVLHFFAMACGHCISLSSLDRQVLAYYWWYDVFNVFVTGLLGSYVTNMANYNATSWMKQNLQQQMTDLGTAIMTSGNYYLSIMSFKAFVHPALKMIIPNGNFYWYLPRKFMRKHKTARWKQQIQMMARSLRNASEANGTILVTLIACAMCIACPLVLVLVILYYIFDLMSLKYRILYLYVRKFESGGACFPVIFERLLGCLFIMVSCTCGCLASKGLWTGALVAWFVLTFAITLEGWYCRHRFKFSYELLPLEVALRAPPARVDPIMYLPVPLHPCAFGWHSYWIKCWQGSGPYPVPSWVPRPMKKVAAAAPPKKEE